MREGEGGARRVLGIPANRGPPNVVGAAVAIFCPRREPRASRPRSPYIARVVSGSRRRALESAWARTIAVRPPPSIPAASGFAEPFASDTRWRRYDLRPALRRAGQGR